MKTTFAVSLMALGAFASLANGGDIINYGPPAGAQEAQQLYLGGKISQVIEGVGVLINGKLSRDGGTVKTGSFLLRIERTVAVDGDYVSRAVVEDGVYEYTTVLGANARVRAFKIVGPLN